MKKPKAPEKTAEQVAVEKRQSIMIDEEIEEQEERLKALSRGTLGRTSLLSGAPATRAAAASASGTRGASRGVGSLLSGTGGTGAGGGGTGPIRSTTRMNMRK